MENLKIFTTAAGHISVATPFSREFIAAARYIRAMADGGPLVEDAIRQYAVKKNTCRRVARV